MCASARVRVFVCSVYVGDKPEENTKLINNYLFGSAKSVRRPLFAAFCVQPSECNAWQGNTMAVASVHVFGFVSMC